MRRALLVIVLCGLGVAGVRAGAQSFLKRDADNLEKKLSVLLERGAQPTPKAPRPLRTSISEQEVNSYFRHQGKEYLPVGVGNPSLAILDGEHVQASAVVNLDAIRASRERSWTDLLNYVSGTVEVKASGKLHASNGMGTFELQTASLNGVPISKGLLQEVISYYSRTPESPEGFALDKPFKLPHQIRQVDLQRGSAIIVQ